MERYHRKKRVKLPNCHVHATFHVIVENQVALGDETPVQRTLARLIREGLSRHDAVHAIGSVLAGQMFDRLKDGAENQDVNAAYYKKVEELTAEAWLKSAEESEGDDGDAPTVDLFVRAIDPTTLGYRNSEQGPVREIGMRTIGVDRHDDDGGAHTGGSPHQEP